MRLKEIFYKKQLFEPEENQTIKKEIDEFVLQTLAIFQKLDSEGIEKAENFIGQALDSYEMEGMKEDFMPFFMDNVRMLPEAVKKLIDAWKEKKYDEAKEIINNHGYMMRFHPNWDEITGYDFYCFVAIINLLSIKDEIEGQKEIIKEWEQLKKTVRSDDYDGIDLNPDVYRDVLDDLIFAFGEINDKQKQKSVMIIKSQYIPRQNKIMDYPNIHAYMRITSYVMELISSMSKLYKKECDNLNK